MIRFLRVLDMPLDEIRLFLSDRKIQTTQEMLKKQKKIILQKQTELKLIEQRINRSLAMIDDALSSEVNIITVKHIPQKNVAWLRTSVSPKAYFYLEPSIRALEKDSNDAVVYLGKVGIGIAKDKLTKGIYKHYSIYNNSSDNIKNTGRFILSVFLLKFRFTIFKGSLEV